MINSSLFQHYLATGVYVVAVTDGKQRNAFTAAWVMPVSFAPPLLAISINPHNYSFSLLQVGGVCSVNVLSKQQLELAAHFGHADGRDKMAGKTWQTAQSGAPILSDSLAYFDCRLSHYVSAGDHTLVICEVLHTAKLNDGQPLLYAETGDMDGSSKLYVAPR